MNTTMLRVAAVSAALLGLSMPAMAQFIGDYAPANWTTSHVPDASADTGTVDINLGSITLNGSNSSPSEPGPFSRLEFTIVAPTAGQVSFSWSYVFNDPDPSATPLFDPAGYRLGTGDAALVQLSDDNGTANQSGMESFNVSAGQTIGFYVATTDNFGGNATLTISDFTTAPIPEPASVAMMSLGLLGLATVAARRRRSN